MGDQLWFVYTLVNPHKDIIERKSSVLISGYNIDIIELVSMFLNNIIDVFCELNMR